MVNYRKNGKLRQTERRPYPRGFFQSKPNAKRFIKRGRTANAAIKIFRKEAGLEAPTGLSILRKRKREKPRKTRKSRSVPWRKPSTQTTLQTRPQKPPRARQPCARQISIRRSTAKNRSPEYPSHFYKRARRRSATAGLLRLQEWSRLTAFKHVHILGNRIENLLALHEIAAAVVYHDFDLVVL